MTFPILLLVPRAAADIIRAGGTSGRITARVSDAQNVGAVIAVGNGNEPVLPTALTPTNHFLRLHDTREVGRWYRVNAELHAAWLQLRSLTGTGLAAQALADATAAAILPTPHIAITHAPDVAAAYPEVGLPDLVAWRVAEGHLDPLLLEVEPNCLGLAQLQPGWPATDLSSTRVLLIGTGSIGGAAALALATYGVGRLLLLDPDRLLWHNLVRHVGSGRDVGQMKVLALADQIRALRPETLVEPFPLNVVENADQVRPLLGRTDVAICAADGVASRRVASHLARRASVPAILACVLEDGSLGEVLRLNPWPSRGCLLCQRQALREAGAIDPEPALDADYGQGTRHRPMTAVGSDLHLVGQFAAKVAVATLLERRGHPDQRLPGEQAIIGLRPKPGRASPFDLSYAGEVRWSPAWPGIPGCPTCCAP